ncbi:hypothetical protein F5877DRAFT_86729 [Lentinula edodes]|nr:hypothetical protein F5877DRAFT_86729 [Lentinula edodes]
MAMEVSPMVAGMSFKLGIRSHFHLLHIQNIVTSFHVPGTTLAFVPEWPSLMEVRKESPRLESSCKSKYLEQINSVSGFLVYGMLIGIASSALTCSRISWLYIVTPDTSQTP